MAKRANPLAGQALREEQEFAAKMATNRLGPSPKDFMGLVVNATGSSPNYTVSSGNMQARTYNASQVLQR